MTVLSPVMQGKFVGTGVYRRRAFKGAPDAEGTLLAQELDLPPFRRGVYYAAIQRNDPDNPNMDWWPDGGNRMQPLPIDSFNGLKRGGIFLLLELEDGEFLALLPLAGQSAMAWFESQNDRLNLKAGTLGTDPYSGDLPLLAWARETDPYLACRRVWETALCDTALAGCAALRETKHYPEVFRYLGWCSWETYHFDISEELILQVIQDIRASERRIRYLLIDDGHFDIRHLNRDQAAPNAPSVPLDHDAGPAAYLRSFEPGPTFPEGWQRILEERDPDGLRWIGLWLNFNGYWRGIDPDHTLAQLRDQFVPSRNGGLLPRPEREATIRFFQNMLSAAGRDGFDFFKIDNQARSLKLYRGLGNAVEGAAFNARALEQVSAGAGTPLINCMAHSSVCAFNTRHSAVTRCSEDYVVGDPGRFRHHLHNSYGNVPWLGQTVWCDHDMFHSSDEPIAALMALSKAMSGGPVCLSDPPGDIRADVIGPLCLEDGELLRPLAPAAPLPESLFLDPLRDARPYRVIAPLENDAAAVVAYNLNDHAPRVDVSVTAEDYTKAGIMLPPDEDPYAAANDQLLLYDWNAQLAARLAGDYRFSLEGFTDRLLLICPIRDDWAVIGRTDKFLSPAAVKQVTTDNDQCIVRLIESGPLTVWSAGGVVTCPEAPVTSIAPGLWRVDLPIGQRDQTVRLNRNQHNA